MAHTTHAEEGQHIAAFARAGLGIAIAGAGIFYFAHAASAATLSLVPSGGDYYAGRNFTVEVIVSSADTAANAAQGVISFPANKLEVLSISKANSVMTLWVQDPSFSNANGVIQFGGVVVNPGYQGARGNVITITFRAKAVGNAPLAFTAGSILANDGSGTNILSAMNGTSLYIAAAPVAPTSTAVLLPAIGTSTTSTASTSIAVTPSFMDGVWSNATSAAFTWTIPTNAVAVDYGISDNPDYLVPDEDRGLTSGVSYDLSRFNDGEWYFFLTFEQGSKWLAPLTKSIWIDRTPPDPFVIVRQDQQLNDSRPVFVWAASDAASGIAGYRVKIGDGDWFDAATIQQGNTYVLPNQSPTKARLLVVRAYDNAGNYRDATATFTVGVPPVALPLLEVELVEAGIGVLVVVIVLGLILFVRERRYRARVRRDMQVLEQELRADLERLAVPRPEGVGVDVAQEIGHVEQEVTDTLQHLEGE